MNCEIVKDLIPLYIDECCSTESAEAVATHIASCPQCKVFYETMNTPAETVSKPVFSGGLGRVNQWAASILQSVLLFLSFGVITVGVALEAVSASFGNAIWALWLVVPATGFMLSLANWYFIKLYKTRKTFSRCSWFLTLGITLCGYVWTIFHYEIQELFFLGGWGYLSLLFGNGICVSVLCCVLSKVLSNIYGKMLGKE